MIRSAALTNYVAVAQSVGVDPYPLLASVGLDRSCLADPEIRIPANAVRQLLEITARNSGTEDFGLRMAENRTLSNVGPLGLVVKEAPTLRDALHAMVRYLRLHNESAQLRIEEDGSSVTVHYQLLTGEPILVRQATELGVGVLFRNMQSLVGAGWEPLAVGFVHGPPANTSRHRRLFGPVVRFGANFNGVVCRARDLEAPIRNADPRLAQYAGEYLDSLLTAGSNAALSEKVRGLVVVLLPAGQCTIDRVAQHLQMNRRTIHRHLSVEGQTFSSLVDDIRAEWALRHLAMHDRTATEIAEMLGFSALSAFSRWFRVRFGCSVAEWRLSRESPSS